MIIKSQNDEILVNSNLVVSYEMEKTSTGYEILACDESLRDYLLATYGTQEEALKALSDLATAISTAENIAIYRMPKA